MVEITTLSIVLMIFGAFCTPFIYSHQKKKQQENQMVSSFMAKAKEHFLHVSFYGLWRRSYMIGLDKDLLQLLYIKFDPQMQMKIVDLKKIKKVNILNEHRPIGPDKQKIIDKLWLHFSHKDPNLPDIDLEFFNADEKDDLMGEQPLIQKWHDLIELSLNDPQEKTVGKRIASVPTILKV